MKVTAINGSPRKNGNTYLALKRVCDELEKQEIETEILQVGSESYMGCRACGACAKLGKCAFGDKDGSNEIAEKLASSDGILIGSPVYYGDINGTLKCLLDRVFYSRGKDFRFKPGAAVVALRRGGAIHTYHTINNYFGITEMIQVPSIYWNDVHGAAVGECEQDEEAMDMMYAIGRNMAYLLKMKEASNIQPPEPFTKTKTNFIR